MFHWSLGEVHVVLTDDEELALVREVTPSGWESAKYQIVAEARRSIQKKMFCYLEAALRADPEAFHRRFVFRSCYGDAAHMIFPVLLNAYGRITRRATFGASAEVPFLEDFPDRIMYRATADLYQVTLLGRGRWPWSAPVPIGWFSFPACTIDKVAGTPDSFFAITDTLHMKFHRDHVRISVLDRAMA
jgi:hypothetical protein